MINEKASEAFEAWLKTDKCKSWNTMKNTFYGTYQFYFAAGFEAGQQAVTPIIDVNEMVNRFLMWKLPKDFAPDGGITFDKTYFNAVTEQREIRDPTDPFWPLGTNLLNAKEAKEMFEYVTQVPAVSYQLQYVLQQLAWRCLWLAYVWNDHNFDKRPAEYARDTAKSFGITSFEAAGDWLNKLPHPPSVELREAVEVAVLASAHVWAQSQPEQHEVNALVDEVLKQLEDKS